MNKLIVAALVLSMSSLAAGCLAPGCGGFTGSSDRVFSRGNDSIILCDNTGFIASVPTGVIEGTYTDADASVVATRGDTASTAFVLTWAPDGTAETTDLGDGAWTVLSLNQVELDHANIQCTDLASRSWWSAQ